MFKPTSKAMENEIVCDGYIEIEDIDLFICLTIAHRYIKSRFIVFRNVNCLN